MYTSQRVASLLIVYTAFVAGMCAACHFLLTTIAATYMSAPQMVAAKSPTGYSRVEGWMRRQATANLKKNALPLKAAVRSATATPSSAPHRDVTHAVVMAAAIDEAEDIYVTPAGRLAIERELRARPLNRHTRLPSCHELQCEKNLNVALQTAELQSRLEPAANVRSLPAAALPTGQSIPRTAKVAGVKIAAALASKRKNGAIKNKAAAKLAYQSRLRAERKVALRRFRETPAEISYRSFVGTFVPAI